MEPALKQRLLGAAVLVALAVTFLPMLVMDPAPESGASDVPLRVPPAPAPGIETRELPLVDPAPAGPAPAIPAEPAEAPRDQAAKQADAADPAPAMFPAPAAGGDYAVSFGSYATAADAARVVGALRASQLPGYAEAVATGTRSLHRVRIGPYATRADAEAARLRAAHVRDDVGAKVVALDAAAPGATPATRAAPAATVAVTPPPKPAAGDDPGTGRTVATAPRPATAAPAAATPAAATPQAPAAPQPAPRPAAAAVGYAVQLGAFSQAAEAQRLQDRARAAGFPAFVEPVRTENGTLHRVRIGPVADRAAADALRSQAAGKLGVSGIVRPHP